MWDSVRLPGAWPDRLITVAGNMVVRNADCTTAVFDGVMKLSHGTVISIAGIRRYRLCCNANVHSWLQTAKPRVMQPQQRHSAWQQRSWAQQLRRACAQQKGRARGAGVQVEAGWCLVRVFAGEHSTAQYVVGCSSGECCGWICCCLVDCWLCLCLTG